MFVLQWRTSRVPMILAAVCAFGEVQHAEADTESPRVTRGPSVENLVVRPGMTATGRNLQGSEFIGQDLTGAVFDGCNLYGVRFHDCNLSNASFQGCVLNGASVDACELNGAIFTNAIINGVGWSNGRFRALIRLTPEQLKSTQSYKTKDLSKCVISGSDGRAEFDFREANLEQAILADGDFSLCVFTKAQINNTTFKNCNIAFDQISSTRDFKAGRLRIELRDMTVFGGISGKCDFSGLDLRGSSLPTNLFGQPIDLRDAIINECTLLGLTKSQLNSTASYERGDLSGISFHSADLSDCDFSGVNLSGSKFANCNVSNASFDDAVITGVSFRPYASAESEGLTAKQIQSTWNFRQRHMLGVVLPKRLVDAVHPAKPIWQDS